MSGKTLQQKINQNISRRLKRTKSLRDRAGLLRALKDYRQAEIAERRELFDIGHPDAAQIPLRTPPCK